MLKGYILFAPSTLNGDGNDIFMPEGIRYADNFEFASSIDGVSSFELTILVGWMEHITILFR